MRHFRVTKYDPAFRNERGVYTRNEWTSLSDVGRVCNGKLVTLDQYLATEDAYLSTARELLRLDGTDALQVDSLENRFPSDAVPENGQVLRGSQLFDTVRRVLREEFWCRFVGPSSFIHVGWDLHMYVGISSSSEPDVVRARELGIFIECFTSPYLTDGSDSEE